MLLALCFAYCRWVVLSVNCFCLHTTVMLTVCYINRQPGKGYHYSDTNACGESAASKRQPFWKKKTRCQPSEDIFDGFSRSSNRVYPWRGSWKTAGPHSYPVTTERIGSRWTRQNVYARATSSRIGNPDRNYRIRLSPHRGPDRDNPAQTYVILVYV